MTETIRNPEVVNLEANKIQEALESKGHGATLEKEHVHEAVTDKLVEVSRDGGAYEYKPTAPPVNALDTPSYFSPELQPLVQGLIDTAWSKGLDTAFRDALATQNAALVDAFRDAVADELFDVLVERKSLEKLAA